MLATATNAPALAATRAGTKVTGGALLDEAFDGSQLVMHVAASNGGDPFTVTATPTGDRTRWVATLAGATDVTLAWDLASAGHWYGNGENVGGAQPWPLDTDLINNTDFSPSSYNMTEPFWFTQRSTGIWVDTDAAMTVRIDGRTTGSATHRADLTVKQVDTMAAVTFVERTPRDVYYDYVGIAGHPTKSDAPDIQYEEPLWNTWAMYSSPVTQANVIGYAQNLKANNLGGFAVQIDDRWSSKYGDFTFDPVKFPDPKAMSAQVHALGYDFGLWVTLWINLDAVNYAYARDHDYLLRSKTDPTKPCTVSWWNGTAGIVDLGNPDAANWFRGQMHQLMTDYDVQGFKFDTRFFDDSCAGRNGLTRPDYQTLGAALADEFDLQGVGIRTHWTGQQKNGFIMRSHDASPNFGSSGLGWSMRQTLSVSVVGYPFVTSDMVGGSSGGNPTDEVLVRWAQAAVTQPIFYASTSPAGPYTLSRTYTPQTLDLYRQAVDRHRAISPYILDQVHRAVATGEPIMKPLFFLFPNEDPTYTINDEWMMGDALLAAPVLVSATQRNIYLPTGTWWDVNAKTMIAGPTTLTNYQTPISVSPLFVRLNDPDGVRVARMLDPSVPFAADGTVGGSVPATLSLTLGTPASFGAFTPGVAKDYTASTTANVISTAGDALLSVADPDANAASVGHLVNGSFVLPSPLQARARNAMNTGTAFNNVGSSASPLNLLTWSAPISNDAVSLEFSQHIGASDALRTGAYAKTLTFTLSTTTP